MAFTPTKARQRDLAPKVKEAKFLRHARRMGKDPATLVASGACLPDPFNGAPKTRRPGGEPNRRAPLPMRGDREIPRNSPAGFVFVDGRILEASPWASDLRDAFNRAHAFPRAIVRLSSLGVLIPSEVKTR